jgi:hypothetical protein
MEAARAVALAGDRLYLVGELSGLQVIDVSAPAAPVVLGSLDTPGRASDVIVNGPLAYIADYHEGLQVVEVSNPAAPRIVGNLETPWYLYRLAQEGPFVYGGDLFAGLVILDLREPLAPRMLGQAVLGTGTEGVAVGDGWIYAAVNHTLFSFPLQCGDLTAASPPPPAPAMLSAHPNPFNPSTRLRFVLEAPSRARLRVVDASGRFVTELLRGDLDAGEQVVDWDGRDAAGHPVASGVYLARLSVSNGSSTEKLVLVR